MSKYAAEDVDVQNETEGGCRSHGSTPRGGILVAPAKKDYLNEVAAELYKSRKWRRPRPRQALEAKRIANLVKPEKVEAFEVVCRIQDVRSTAMLCTGVNFLQMARDSRHVATTCA